MSDWETVRRQIAIAGQVTAAGENTAVPNACVQITAAPQTFTAQVHRLSKLAGRPPIDRVNSRADGSFFFLDLPDGDYTLTTWMPGRQPAYDPVVVESRVVRDTDGRIQPTPLQIALSPRAGTAVPPPEPLPTPAPPPARAPAFTPTSLTGCALWLDASTLTGIADGRAVAAWPDNSGRNHAAAQTNAANQPVYRRNAINGRPALQFNGEDQFLALSLAENGTEHTFFFVLDNTPGGGHSHTLFDAQSGRLALNAADTSSPANVRYNDGSWRTVGIAIAGPQQMTWRFGGQTGALFRNGVLAGTAVYAARALTGQLVIGANYQGRSSFFTGLIAEIIYYNRALPDPDRQAVENYLHGRYAI
jgi:hypothetical protein